MLLVPLQNTDLLCERVVACSLHVLSCKTLSSLTLWPPLSMESSQKKWGLLRGGPQMLKEGPSEAHRASPVIKLLLFEIYGPYFIVINVKV